MASIISDHNNWSLKIYSSVHVRTGEPFADGKRRQQTIKLCDIDAQHKSKGDSTVLMLSAERVKKIEAWEAQAATDGPRTHTAADPSVKISDFFNNVYMPARRTLSESNPDDKMSPTTVTSNRVCWDTYLAKHFNGTKTFQNYTSSMAVNFLTYLRNKDGQPYGENTLRQICSTARRMFRYAMSPAGGKLIDHNPWRDIDLKEIPSTPTEEGVAYTEAQVEAMIKNLYSDTGSNDNVDAAQLAIALSFWTCLRPGEIIGLRWENVDLEAGELRIVDNVVYGVEKGPKTGERIVPIPEADCAPLATMLHNWKRANGDPTKGFVLQNRDGGAIDLKKLGERHIGPSCKANGLGDLWEGNAFYGGRRGGITMLIQRGAEPQDVARLAGNTYKTIEKHYLKDTDNRMAKRAMGVSEKHKRGGQQGGMRLTGRLTGRRAIGTGSGQ